jgi:alpha-galactosidase
VALYDIDLEAAQLNEELCTWLQGQPGVVSCWQYSAVPTLAEAITRTDFVVLSI